MCLKYIQYVGYSKKIVENVLKICSLDPFFMYSKCAMFGQQGVHYVPTWHQ